MTEEKPQSVENHIVLLQAMITKLEGKIELQEQLLSGIVNGYIDLSALVEALITCQPEENKEKFSLAFAESKKKILETLSIGHAHAQDLTDKFVSSDTGTNT